MGETLEEWGISPGDVETGPDLYEIFCEGEAKKAAMKDFKSIGQKVKGTQVAALKECAGLFERMDIDQDGELSLQDLETVVDSKIKNNVDNSQIREFVDAMANLDLNNDEIIDNGEFMSACLNN